MKKLFLFVISFLTFNQFALAQTSSCCSKSVTGTFASLGNDEAFVSSHLAPIPFHFTPVNGALLNITTPDGVDAQVYYVKSNEGNKTLILIHEWWGLNDYIKQEAEKWATELGVNVIAPDLYDGKVATTPDEAKLLMQELKDERARAILSGCIDYCGPKSQLQTIGWCMGGGWSMQTALMAGPNTKGCVMYYGMPEKDKDKLSKLKAPVLGIFAKKDEWINADVVKQFQTNMKTAGKKLTVYNYDADHAFANPSNPKYDKVATADAHAKALEFLKGNFK